MSDGFILATTSEGLQMLGSAAQRSYELISGTVRLHLGAEAAAIFAEPISTARGAAIEWYAPVAGQVVEEAALSEAEREALRADLARHVAAIAALAARIEAQATPDAFWLAEALRHALEVPQGQGIWAVRGAAGGVQPVLVNWARLREERQPVRGVLTTLAPRAARPPQPAPASVPTPVPAEVPPNRAAEPAPLPVARQGLSLWPLLILGWVLLAAMIGALVWLMVAPCGLRPGLGGYCAAPLADADPRGDLLRELAALEHRLSQEQQACELSRATDPAPAPSELQPSPPLKKSETLPGTLAPQGGGSDRRLALWTAGAALSGLRGSKGLRASAGPEQAGFEQAGPEQAGLAAVEVISAAKAGPTDRQEIIPVTAPLTGRYHFEGPPSATRPSQGPTDVRQVLRQKGAGDRRLAGSLWQDAPAWTRPLETPAR